MKYIATNNIVTRFMGKPFLLVAGDIFEIKDFKEGMYNIICKGKSMNVKTIELKGRYRVYEQ